MLLAIATVEGLDIGPKVDSYIVHSEPRNAMDDGVFELGYE